MARREGQRGQSTVEVLAFLPIVLLCGVLGLQGLIAGANFVVADNAAHAGALAGELGDDPRAAARSAAPGWATSRIDVRVRGRRVGVRLRPRALFPPLARLLVARSEARYWKP
jgi:hypothetical protein